MTISANGLMQCLEFPQGDPPGPCRVFCQQLNANICSSHILDIDNDGRNEMIVVMTDRVGKPVTKKIDCLKILVRTYRFVQQAERIIPLNKWEMPAQISGWAIGFDRFVSKLICAIFWDCDQMRSHRVGGGYKKGAGNLKKFRVPSGAYLDGRLGRP